MTARRMWYDTVGHGHVTALKCAIDSFGADRLVLGTDFPYENGDTYVHAIDYINDPQIDPVAARAILATTPRPYSASDSSGGDDHAPHSGDDHALVAQPPARTS